MMARWEFTKDGLWQRDGGSATKYLKEPCLDPMTAKPWWQVCYVCGTSADLRPGRELIVRVTPYVRHKRCLPDPIV